MKANAGGQEDKQHADLRAIPKWARRYAQSRRVAPRVLAGLLVAATIPLILFLIFRACSIGSFRLYMTGYAAFAQVLDYALVGLHILFLWLLWRNRGRLKDAFLALERKFNNWMYRAEGEVAASPERVIKWSPQWLKYPWVILGVAPIFILPISRNFLPPQYWQPLTALLWVPLLSYIIVRPMRGGPVPSRLRLLWPGLYGLYAVLQVSGIIRLPNPKWQGFEVGAEMVIAAFGCTIITALAIHIYSRIALRRLRTLATSPEMTDETGGQKP